MGRVRWAVLLAALGGCLEDGGDAGPGRLILAGREPRRPNLVSAGDRLFVLYETLKPPDAPIPEAPRLWAVPYEGGQPRKLAENGAWPVTREERGTVLVLHDLEGRTEDPSVRWFPHTPASLTRVDLATGRSLAEYPLILDFGFWRGQLFIETAAEGRPLRELVVERESGPPARVGPAMEMQWSRGGELFAIVPGDDKGEVEERLLVRIRQPGASPEMLAHGVAELMLHPSGQLAIWRSPNDHAWLLDLFTDAVTQVDIRRGCVWLGFVPGTRRLLCAEAKAPETAELHVVDLDLRQDRALSMACRDPRGLELEWAPGGRLGLVRERGRAWLLRPDAVPALELLADNAFRATFSPDGRAVAYLEVSPLDADQSNERLVVRDTALAAPARVLTPPFAWVQSFFFTDDGLGLLDVTHFGDYKAKLHHTDLGTGRRVTIAEALGWWIWPWGPGTVVVEPQVMLQGSRALLVDEWSQQDRVGELVLVDLATRARKVLASGAADFSVEAPCPKCGLLRPGARAVVAVHERFASPRDGLWAITLP